jgi:hypothetical protein
MYFLALSTRLCFDAFLVLQLMGPKCDYAEQTHQYRDRSEYSQITPLPLRFYSHMPFDLFKGKLLSP